MINNFLLKFIEILNILTYPGYAIFTTLVPSRIVEVKIRSRIERADLRHPMHKKYSYYLTNTIILYKSNDFLLTFLSSKFYNYPSF